MLDIHDNEDKKFRNPIFSLTEKDLELLYFIFKKIYQETGLTINIDEYGDGRLHTKCIQAIIRNIYARVKVKEYKYMYDKEYKLLKSLLAKFMLISEKKDGVIYVGD